jgi:hypothetical protein
VENLRRASGTLLSEHVTKGKHAARDLYFVYQYKLGGPMSFALANAAIDERAFVKPTVEREKTLRPLAQSFQSLQKSTNGVSAAATKTFRPGDLLVKFTTSQRNGTVAVVQSVSTSMNDTVMNTLMFDESDAAAGITKASVPPTRVKNEDSYFVLRPVDTKFVSLWHLLPGKRVVLFLQSTRIATTVMSKDAIAEGARRLGRNQHRFAL